jgi:hypothetical protein
VANVANVDLQLFSGAAGDKTVSTTTGDGGRLVVWMIPSFMALPAKILDFIVGCPGLGASSVQID